jgi:hypothetical protein
MPEQEPALQSAPTGPSSVSEPSPVPTLEEAVAERLLAGYRPGVNEQWKPFCDKVRERAKVANTDRGCGDKSVQRIVRRVKEQRGQT